MRWSTGPSLGGNCGGPAESFAGHEPTQHQDTPAQRLYGPGEAPYA